MVFGSTIYQYCIQTPWQAIHQGLCTLLVCNVSETLALRLKCDKQIMYIAIFYLQGFCNILIAKPRGLDTVYTNNVSKTIGNLSTGS